jgi:hypothetical protein
VDLEVQNKGRKVKTVHPSDVNLSDEQGRRFDASTGVSGYISEGQDVLFAPLQPGSTRRAQIAFDIPRDANGLKLNATDLDPLVGGSAHFGLGK